MSRTALAIYLALACVAAQGAGIDVQVRDTSGTPIADAAVYAVPVTGPTDVRPGRTAAIEQVDREFLPYVSVIQAGTTVTFPNRDPIMHHVYSFSPAKLFEIKLYTGKSPSQILFDKVGVVTLGCNIHDWMIAYVLVVATPHFAKTDPAGNARLRDLPAGSYEVRAWHPQQRAAAAPQTFALESAAPVPAAFALQIMPRKAHYKPPLDRLKY
jgi:plastocyanin